MCYLATCSSPGAWKPILKFRSRSNGPATILHFKSISTCEEHRKTSTVDSFLSEEGFDKLARHLRDAGKILGIELIDHIIVTSNGFLSFKDNGLI